MSLSGLFRSAQSRVAPSRTGLCTDSPTVFFGLIWISAGTTARFGYYYCVFGTSKEEPNMEPRQLRLPGFTRLWASERRRIGLRQLQPLRSIGQRIFVAVGAVEQQHALVAADQPPLQRLAPSRQHRPAFGAEQKAVALRRVIDGAENRIFGHRNRRAFALAHRPQDQEIADGFG